MPLEFLATAVSMRIAAHSLPRFARQRALIITAGAAIVPSPRGASYSLRFAPFCFTPAYDIPALFLYGAAELQDSATGFDEYFISGGMMGFAIAFHWPHGLGALMS